MQSIQERIFAPVTTFNEPPKMDGRDGYILSGGQRHPRPMLNDIQFARLERRMLAATCDAMVIGCCCLAMYFAREHAWIWNAGLVLLVSLGGVECLTGISPGKWLWGWSLSVTSGPWPRLRLALRGLARHLPVAIFVFALFGTEQFEGRLALLGTVGMLATVFVSASYLSVIRRELTAFDLIAGTRLQASSERTPA